MYNSFGGIIPCTHLTQSQSQGFTTKVGTCHLVAFLVSLMMTVPVYSEMKMRLI